MLYGPAVTAFYGQPHALTVLNTEGVSRMSEVITAIPFSSPHSGATRGLLADLVVVVSSKQHTLEIKKVCSCFLAPNGSRVPFAALVLPSLYSGSEQT